MTFAALSERSLNVKIKLSGLVLGSVLVFTPAVWALGTEPSAAQVVTKSQSSVLMDLSKGAIGISFSQNGGTNELLISSHLKAPKFKASTLENPTRIVVDLEGVEGVKSESFKIQNNPTVDSVRVGPHPGKSRLVVELKRSGLTHAVEKTDGGVRITVNDGNVAPVAALPAVNPKVEDVAVSKEPTSPTVTSVRLESDADGSNKVVTGILSAGFFDFKKTAPSEYVLRLEGASLDPIAQGTLVAPPLAGNIRSVRPVISGNDVLLRIFAKPGVELAAMSKKGEIVVSSYAARENGREAIRAQLAIQDDDGIIRAEGDNDSNSVTKEEFDNTIGADASEGEKTAEDATVTESEEVTDDSTAATSAEEEEAAAEGGEEDLASLLEQEEKYSGRLISLDLQDTDIDNALRIIAEVSNLNIIASEDVAGKVTLRLIDVPWDQALDVILKTNGLDKVQEGNVIRVAPVDKLRTEREALREAQRAEEELEPLSVRYIRISYSQAAEIQPVVETVLTERGSVTQDSRTNQLIVKDIKKGLNNVVELVKKLDLRTPQVLLETQIIEAKRDFLRDLGSELGFSYIASPETGNATGVNFPNSINVGGSFPSPGSPVSSFPAALTASTGSAITAIFDSADGTKSLSTRITSLEQDGRLKIISRPSVATINNKPALIKSVEKFRVRLPSGGLSVATGQGSNAGGASAATEVIEIGITLEMTPQASPDYFVLLDLKMKSSTANFNQVVDGIPAENERQATSTVLVSSGQTFAVGGIYKVSDNDTISGVPFLKDVPVFGSLFRNAATKNGDEELIFFVTPRIVEGSFDDAAMRSAS